MEGEGERERTEGKGKKDRKGEREREREKREFFFFSFWGGFFVKKTQIQKEFRFLPSTRYILEGKQSKKRELKRKEKKAEI